MSAIFLDRAARSAWLAVHAAPHGPVGRVLDLGIRVGGISVTVGSLILGIIVLVVAVVASWLLRHGLRRYGNRYPSSQPTLYTLARVVHYTVLVVGALVALSVAGVPFSKFALFAGALGVGLGFGLQAIFSNFISGLVILFDRSLTVGDFVEMPNGLHGVVRDIHIRATRITTNDNIDYLIPNSRFITDNVVNLTWRDVSRRAHIPFRVPYGTDKALARKAALEAAAGVPFTLSDNPARQPQVWLTGFGESAMEFALVLWLNAGAARRYRGVIAAYNWALHDALEKHGLELPFPQRDLHVKSWPGMPGPARDGGDGSSPRQAPGSGSVSPPGNDALHAVQRDMAERATGDARTDHGKDGPVRRR